MKLDLSGYEEGIEESLPARERGLKLECMRRYAEPFMSLPARERGLKPYEVTYAGKHYRRSPRGSVD